jgi:hypothetical protein
MRLAGRVAELGVVRPHTNAINNMTSEIAGFVAALGHATNIAKALINARDEVNRTNLAVDFNAALIDVQTRQMAVVEKNHSLLQANEALNKQLAAYDKWELEKARYSLRQLSSGGFIYVVNPAEQAADPPHWICTNCHQERHKSILQLGGIETGERTGLWICPRCKTKIISNGEWPTTLK